MMIGRFAAAISASTGSSADGSGQARGGMVAVRTYGRSSRPASSSKDENMMSTGKLMCTGPG